MRAVLIIGLLMVNCLTDGFLCSAQTASLPAVILDSMIFEVKRGRQCELVIKSQAGELQKQGQELAHTNTALKLSQSESRTLESLVSNAKESQNLDFQQYALDLGKEKRKKRKWRNGFFILVAVIAVKEGLNTLD